MLIGFFMLLATAVFSSAVAYPLLHECGHIAAALACGAEVVKVGYFPVPYVCCDMAAVGSFGLIVTAAAGLLLPFSVAFLLSPRRGLLCHLILCLRVINMLDMLLSLVYSVLFFAGISYDTSDAVKILSAFPDSAAILFFVLCMLFVCMLLRTVRALYLQGVKISSSGGGGRKALLRRSSNFLKRKMAADVVKT